MHLAFAFLILFEPSTAIQSSKSSINDESMFSGGSPDTLVAPPKRTHIKIPSQLVMTAKSGGIDDLPMKQRRNVRETLGLNPGLTLRFLNDEACREFISQNFDFGLLSAFDNETHGSYRGDICRAAVLAIEGGFYADVDVQFRVPFGDIVDEDTTFMSAIDIYCNVLNALIATEQNSAVMQSVIAAIKGWYANPSASRPKGSFLGTVTMREGLNHVVSRDCPGMDITMPDRLQRACGSHHQFRFYKEAKIECNNQIECPLGRRNNSFPGVRFGLFEPGAPERNLVAWSRFESCGKWGCQERGAHSAEKGNCGGGFDLAPAYHPKPKQPVAKKSTYKQVKSAGQCCRGDSIYFSGDSYARTPAGCESLCDKNPACRFFDHATTWNNCFLCADCDEGNSDQAAYAWFTSWEKPTPAPRPTPA